MKFLRPDQNSSGNEQSSRLRKLQSAPVLLGERVLEWAKTHPQDKRLPEALHLVVRATRWGCGKDKGRVSQAAYRILHQRYPDSEWTTKTPYWYN